MAGGRATLLYDGECRFCRWSAGMLIAWDRRGRLRPVALQDEAAARLLPDLSAEQRMESVHAVTAAGERRSGGAAFVPILALLPAGRPLSRLAGRFPGAADRAYEATSKHRDKLIELVPRRLQRFASRQLQRRSAA